MINIFLQPANRTFAVPNSFTVEVGAGTSTADNYLTYRWEYSTTGTSGWTAINSSSASTSVLNITLKDGVLYGNNFFRCVVTEMTNAGAQADQQVSAVAWSKQFDGRTGSSSTKSRDAAKIRSRSASHIEYNPDPSLSAIFTGGNLGNPDLFDADDWVTHPTVQSAIVDLATSMSTPVDGIRLMAANRDPSGMPQQSLLRFTGTVQSDIGGEPAHFAVFGRKITMPDGALAAQVRDEVLTVLNEFETAGMYVKNVTVSGSDGITYEHRDNKDHPVHGWTQYGVTMTGSIASPAAYGYGQWSAVGTVSSTGTGGITMYAWRRTA